MAKRTVIGETVLTVYKEIEIDDEELEGKDEFEVEDAFLDRAYDEFEGLNHYAGNGGLDSLVGVQGEGERLGFGEVDFEDVTEE